MEQQFNPPQDNTREFQSKSKKRSKNKPKDDQLGEYIDYEEID
jgi:hypothetical protein